MKQKIKIVVVFLLIATCMFSSCQAIPTQQTEEIYNDFTKQNNAVTAFY